jgi:hypothetical protein
MENPMRQSLRTPIMSMGVIPSKVHLDWVHVEEAMRNAEDPNTAPNSYPGGSKDVNHDVMPGDLSIGWKDVRDPMGGFNELGFVSLNGFYMGGGKTHREAEDSVYVQGVAVTECRVSDPMGNSSTQDPDHGYAIVKAGTAPTLNNGPKQIFPNNFVAARFPPSMLNTFMGTEDNDNKFESGTNQRARMGTFASQIRPELVPFDYTDFHIHYDSAHAAMLRSQTANGISDISLDEMLKRRKGFNSDVPQLSAEQEEAIGHYWSLVNILAAINESGETVSTLVAAATQPGAQVQPKIVDIFKRAFYRSISLDVDDAKNSVEAVAGSNPSYRSLRQLGSTLHSGHVMGNYYSKTSKIIGKSMNNAGPSETMDLLLGHFCL